MAVENETFLASLQLFCRQCQDKAVERFLAPVGSQKADKFLPLAAVPVALGDGIMAGRINDDGILEKPPVAVAG